MTWNLDGVLPVRWTGPSLNQDSSKARWRPSSWPTTGSCRDGWPGDDCSRSPSRSPVGRSTPRGSAQAHGDAGAAAGKHGSPRQHAAGHAEDVRRRSRADGGSQTGRVLGGVEVPVQPEGSHDREDGEMGTRTGQERQDGRTTGVQRRRPLQAHRGDVLRRHQHPGRRGRHRGGAALQLLRPDREESGPRTRQRRRWWSSTGARSAASPPSSPRSAPSTPCSPPTACRSGRSAASRWRRCRVTRSSRTPLPAATTSAGCTARWPATRSPRRLRRVRRSDDVAAVGRLQPDRRPAAAAGGHRCCCCRPPRSWPDDLSICRAPR